MDRNVAVLQLIDWMLKRMNFIGGDGKFGITSRSTEFLRVSFNEYGARGYPARSVAGIVLRKPWSDSPMSELDVINSTIDAVRICRRRGLKLNGSEDKLLRIWCRKNKISYIAARTPIINGGYGIWEPIENTRVHGLPKLGQAKGVRVEIVTDWRYKNWEIKSQKYGVAIDQTKLQTLAHEDAAATVVGDEVNGLTNGVRKKWKEELAEANVKITKLLDIGVTYKERDAEIELMANGEEVKRENSFGSFADMRNVITDITRLLETKQKVNEWIRQNRITYWQNLNTLGKRLGSKDAEAWLLGDLPSDMDIYNPIASGDFKNIIANNIKIGSVPKNRLTDIWIKTRRYVIRGMQKSEGVRATMMW